MQQAPVAAAPAALIRDVRSCTLPYFPCTSTPQLLLLGFGDVRHVLATAAACAAQPATKCRRLTFHLNDIGPLNVARGILLLHLVSWLGPLGRTVP